MDLKRAWRNGFLVSVIFAIPLSDLYNNQLSNLVVDNRAGETRAERMGSFETDSPCTSMQDVRNADDRDRLSVVPSSWDNSVDEDDLTIPGNTLADLLPESDPNDIGNTIGNIQQAVVQFDPQDIFLSEPIRDFDAGTSGNPRQSNVANFGSHYAPGFSGPFTPAMFPGAGKAANAGLQNASEENSDTPFIDPLGNSLAQTETGDPTDNSSKTTTIGTGNDSLHNVPEPPSFVLITIGTLSVATLLYRKSKASTPLS